MEITYAEKMKVLKEELKLTNRELGILIQRSKTRVDEYIHGENPSVDVRRHIDSLYQDLTDPAKKFGVEGLVERLGSKKDEKELEMTIRKTKIELTIVKNLLEYFKDMKPEQRQKLRDAVPGENVGYLLSLMRAVFTSENALDDWISLTTYKWIDD